MEMSKNCCKTAMLKDQAQPFRTKWWSSAKNLCKICDFETADATLSHETKVEPQKLTYI
jgi:hypothetical protein